MVLRQLIGEVLRRHRVRQDRTLRDVSAAAKVSLGYLSEVERGRKEASSELLAAICDALNVSLAQVLREVSDELYVGERAARVALGFRPDVHIAPIPGKLPVASSIPGVKPMPKTVPANRPAPVGADLGFGFVAPDAAAHALHGVVAA